jgi:hypothetical protein
VALRLQSGAKWFADAALTLPLILGRAPFHVAIRLVLGGGVAPFSGGESGGNGC